jgi:hypothetical protein
MIELLGEDATLALIEAHGGTRVNVPKAVPAQHPLRDLLGEARFALLFQYFGGTEIVVPQAREWRLRLYQRRGMTRREMARRLGLTENRVYAKLRGDRREPGQLTLNF